MQAGSVAAHQHHIDISLKTVSRLVVPMAETGVRGEHIQYRFADFNRFRSVIQGLQRQLDLQSVAVSRRCGLNRWMAEPLMSLQVSQKRPGATDQNESSNA